MTALLRAQGLRKSYGTALVLRGIDIEVGAGEAHVVIGPNGAGKTTLFRVLSGEIGGDAGTVAFDGRDVTALDGFRRARLGLGRTFQTARVFSEMTVAENVVVALEAAARIQSGRAWPRLIVRPAAGVARSADTLIEEFGLGARAAARADALAHGDRKRLELAMALALRPRLLLLDEPTAGMAPGERQATVALLSRLMREHGLALLLTEHDMGVVFGLAQRLTVLNYGAVIASGAPEAVRGDARVRDVYLGHADAA